MKAKRCSSCGDIPKPQGSTSPQMSPFAAARQQNRSQQPARMPKLAPIERGPWASRKAATRREFGEGLDGPDYDPGACNIMTSSFDFHLWCCVAGERKLEP